MQSAGARRSPQMLAAPPHPLSRPKIPAVLWRLAGFHQESASRVLDGWSEGPRLIRADTRLELYRKLTPS